MLERKNNIITLKNDYFNCQFVLNERQVRKRCLEYQQRKLFKPVSEKLENIKKDINKQLKKERCTPVPRHIYYNFIYFVYIAKNTKTTESYLKWYKENYIFNQSYYEDHSCSYCRFLELEYKYRDEIQNAISYN